jgi:hypothetical protein
MGSPRTPVKSAELLLEHYLRRIPSSLRDLLVPRTRRERYRFAKAIKALRIREEERNYVRELQKKFDLPLRPNETVKETMIRVRLRRFRDIRRSAGEGWWPDCGDNFPTDPLE